MRYGWIDLLSSLPAFGTGYIRDITRLGRVLRMVRIYYTIRYAMRRTKQNPGRKGLFVNIWTGAFPADGFQHRYFVCGECAGGEYRHGGGFAVVVHYHHYDRGLWGLVSGDRSGTHHRQRVDGLRYRGDRRDFGFDIDLGAEKKGVKMPGRPAEKYKRGLLPEKAIY